MRGYRPTTQELPPGKKPPKRGEEEFSVPPSGGSSGSKPVDLPTIEGMPMRDWLAVHASSEDIRRFRSCFVENYDGRPVMKMLSVEQARYAYADAMLAAREGK